MTAQLTLHSLFALRQGSFAEIARRLGAGPEDLAEGVAYDKARGLRRLHHPETHPARFYFRGDDLVVIHIDDPAFLLTFDPEEFRDALGLEDAELVSRAGPRSSLYVYAGRGLAWSESPEGVDYVEVFPPMTMASYLANLYDEPGPFGR